jgi:hypothetical protein
MRRCLSERALLKLVADADRTADRAHLAACGLCDARYRAIMRDLDRVSDVLLHSEPPPWSRSVLARYWLPATAAAVAVVALLVWVEITVWRAVTPAPPEEVTAFLSDLSTTMFSMGDAVAATDEVGADASDDTLAAGCSSDTMGVFGCESDNDRGRSP